jgi:hypothetical protein
MPSLVYTLEASEFLNATINKGGDLYEGRAEKLFKEQELEILLRSSLLPRKVNLEVEAKSRNAQIKWCNLPPIVHSPST